MSPEARNRHRYGAKGPGGNRYLGDRYNSSAAWPGKNDQSGRVKTRSAGSPCRRTGTNPRRYSTRPAPSCDEGED